MTIGIGQRQDRRLDAILRTEALLEEAIRLNMKDEAERLEAQLKRLTDF